MSNQLHLKTKISSNAKINFSLKRSQLVYEKSFILSIEKKIWTERSQPHTTK